MSNNRIQILESNRLPLLKEIAKSIGLKNTQTKNKKDLIELIMSITQRMSDEDFTNIVNQSTTITVEELEKQPFSKLKNIAIKLSIKGIDKYKSSDENKLLLINLISKKLNNISNESVDNVNNVNNVDNVDVVSLVSSSPKSVVSEILPEMAPAELDKSLIEPSSSFISEISESEYAEIFSLSLSGLKNLATRLKIKKFSNLRKDELRDTILNFLKTKNPSVTVLLTPVGPKPDLRVGTLTRDELNTKTMKELKEIGKTCGLKGLQKYTKDTKDPLITNILFKIEQDKPVLENISPKKKVTFWDEVPLSPEVVIASPVIASPEVPSSSEVVIASPVIASPEVVIASPNVADLRQKLINIDSNMLIELLKMTGYSTDNFTDKDDIIEYIISATEKRFCDPEENKQCDSTFVCDINSEPKLCVSENVAKRRISRKELKQTFYKNKTIVGSKSAIRNFNTKHNIKEGTEITDINELLTKIKANRVENINNLSAIQIQIVKCLGLTI